MTLVVTMSANTAAYAAQAVKPSARVSGDGPTEEAITLLSARPKDEIPTVHAPVAALRHPTSLSLMLMNSYGRLPQGTSHDALRRYREFEMDNAESEQDEAEPDRDEGDADAGGPEDWVARLPTRDDPSSE